MPVMFELTELNASQFFTGSVYPPAHSSATTSAVVGGSNLSTGSWQGLSNTWGVDTQASDQLISSSGGIVNAGIWRGIAYSYDVVTTPSESIDRFSLTSEENPSINQGAAAGEWDPFPVPPPPPEPEAKIRDLTRYVKTYSSQRLQVQRIRYSRKRRVT